MSPTVRKQIEQTLTLLRAEVGDALHSCCVYGSAVRGNFIEGKSDVNLLIVLNGDEPAAHEAITKAIGKQPLVDPFIVSKEDLPRTAQVFAAKFVSIKQNYEVIHGPDVLANLAIDPDTERFLCEQALRNLQLRMVYAYVMRRRKRSYQRFLAKCVTPLFVRLSEVLRLEGISVPKEFEQRVALFERHFLVEGTIFRRLLALKAGAVSAGREPDETWHRSLFPEVEKVVKWIDKKWLGK